MDQKTFRKELVSRMPGYKWTIHREDNPDIYISATGIQSSGFNRISTLFVVRRNLDGVVYEVKSSSHGASTPWLHECKDGTLATALRGLQDHYEHMASLYAGHAMALKVGRLKKEGQP